MFQFLRAMALMLLLIPLASSAMVEPDTKREYPDEIAVGTGEDAYTLVGTGVGLREKTFLKVDVYLLASYVDSEASFSGDQHIGLMEYQGNKRLVMDLTRSFSADKLKNAFREVIEKNYDDRSAFQDDMDTMLSYFVEEAREGDNLVFDYHPPVGLTTTLNGKVLGVIENFEFVKALWSVWFGEVCADKGVRKDLLKNLG
jgi:hypothetical protein